MEKAGNFCECGLKEWELFLYVHGFSQAAAEADEGEDEKHDCYARDYCHVGCVKYDVAVVLFYHASP